MWNNRYTLYLSVGCAVILISGLGLAYQFMPAGNESRDATRDPQLSVQSGAAQSPAPAQWPPANGAVAFHDEMVDLLTPSTQTTAAPEPQQTAPQQTAEPQQTAPQQTAPQQTAPQREVIRDAGPEQRSRTSRRRQAPPNDGTSRDGRSPRDDVGAIDGRDGRRYARERDVYVRGRDGRRYRIDPDDRAEADGEPPSDPRGYRIEREPPPERRGLMPDPFRMFEPPSGW